MSGPHDQKYNTFISSKRKYIKQRIQALNQMKLSLLSDFTENFGKLERIVLNSLEKTDDTFLSECNEIDAQLNFYQNYCLDLFYKLNFPSVYLILKEVTDY